MPRLVGKRIDRDIFFLSDITETVSILRYIFYCRIKHLRFQSFSGARVFQQSPYRQRSPARPPPAHSGTFQELCGPASQMPLPGENPQAIDPEKSPPLIRVPAERTSRVRPGGRALWPQDEQHTRRAGPSSSRRASQPYGTKSPAGDEQVQARVVYHAPGAPRAAGRRCGIQAKRAGFDGPWTAGDHRAQILRQRRGFVRSPVQPCAALGKWEAFSRGRVKISPAPHPHLRQPKQSLSKRTQQVFSIHPIHDRAALPGRHQTPQPGYPPAGRRSLQVVAVHRAVVLRPAPAGPG